VIRWVVAVFLALAPAPLLAQWQVAESVHFRLHGELDAVQLAERAALLEDFHGLLVRATGRRLPPDAPRLDVFLVDSIAEMAPQQSLPADAAGYYLADSGRISAVALARSPGGQQGLSAQELLLHEYAHHFMLGAGRFAYPAWYVEGFAEYFATAAFGPGEVRVGQVSPTRRMALDNGRWLPMERLLAREPQFAQGNDAAMFYAQSWLLTHYMFRTPGLRDRFSAYLKAFASGADPEVAFRAHIDRDLGGFEQKLRRYLRSSATFSSVDRPAGTPEAVKVVALQPDASRFLTTMVLLEHAGPAMAGGDASAAVRRLTGPNPVDPFARRALALAELEAGNSATAAALLDGLLAATPDDPDLLRWRAQAARADRTVEGMRTARDLLTRAVAVAPSDWRVLHAYARLQRSSSGAMPGSSLDALLKAHALAPQVSEIVLDTALALSQAGRLAEAATVLEPLAWSPHGGQAASIAQRMLARARAGDRDGLLAQVSSLSRQQSAKIAAVQSR
jgi:tetratricopeptide (TPR) repeat protein